MSVFWALYPYHCTDGVKFGMEEGTFPPCKISLQLVQHVEKPQNRPLSNLNTGALCCAQCCW